MNRLKNGGWAVGAPGSPARLAAEAEDERNAPALQPLPCIDAAIPAAEIESPCVLYLAADGCETLTFSVPSLVIASLAFIAYRDLYNLGASDLAENCGIIYGPDHKTVIARISYNGRAWSPDGKTELESVAK